METPKKARLSTKVVQAIINDIDNGIYQPGDQLPTEHQLCEKFAVSRTVIREVIANLRASHLIETRQGKGAFVAQKPTFSEFHLSHSGGSASDELAYILDLRIAIEAEAALMAAKYRSLDDIDAIKQAISEMASLIDQEHTTRQADRNFHYAVAMAAKNPHFVNLLRYIDNRLMAQETLTPVQYKVQALKEHEQICHAIERGDPDAARAAMRLHLSGSRERLLARLHAR